eukprot:CAMPEP_0179175070 /NCGR_PEP_ID=MMETSP0796-20121207/86448_1 /TAXON_ID=73915 /ORGANISM="Pyrodinium bahamense, Strain pbaha01" /LENGTH=41 /DNA_ID= /DNA_START= /DNA_END= /DNA_ORIENTATION=
MARVAARAMARGDFNALAEVLLHQRNWEHGIVEVFAPPQLR